MSVACAHVPGTVLHTGRLLQGLPSGGCDDFCCSQKMNLGGRGMLRLTAGMGRAAPLPLQGTHPGEWLHYCGALSTFAFRGQNT